MLLTFCGMIPATEDLLTLQREIYFFRVLERINVRQSRTVGMNEETEARDMFMDSSIIRCECKAE